MLAKNPAVRDIRRNQSQSWMENVEKKSEAPMLKRSE